MEIPKFGTFEELENFLTRLPNTPEKSLLIAIKKMLLKRAIGEHSFRKRTTRTEERVLHWWNDLEPLRVTDINHPMNKFRGLSLSHTEGARCSAC